MHIFFVFAVFSFGYFLWAKLIERVVEVDCIRPTPAIEKYDKIDFVPTKPLVLFGHHFSSIAGVGPIVGPILAIKFGWIPTLLWLVFGVIFIGSVHDFSSLMLSVRHGGESIGGVIRRYLGARVGKAYFIFTLTAILLVIAVFTRIIAVSFETNPYAASASLFLIPSSVLLGFAIRSLSLPQLVAGILALFVAICSVFLGMKFPVHLSRDAWIFILIVYCFFASSLPVWLLLQPRDFSSSFILFLFLVLGVLGILINMPQIRVPAFSDNPSDLVLIFPMLFVTVACGAVSGFHSLVASGTTSKQISSECHARPIGYGAMLFESLLGVLSLTALAIFTKDEYLSLIGEKGDKVVSAFGVGIAQLSRGLMLPPEFIKNFAILALSTFALTSLDTATRIGRYIIEELMSSSGEENINQESNAKLSSKFKGAFSSMTVIGFAVVLLFSGGADVLWPLFGTSNQLLAAFALITAWVWASQSGYKSRFFAFPALFMLIITISALLIQIRNFIKDDNFFLLVVSLLLLSVSLYIVFSSFRKIIGPISASEKEEI